MPRLVAAHELNPEPFLKIRSLQCVLNTGQAGTQSTHHCKHHCGQQEHKIKVALNSRGHSLLVAVVQ